MNLINLAKNNKKTLIVVAIVVVAIYSYPYLLRVIRNSDLTNPSADDTSVSDIAPISAEDEQEPPADSRPSGGACGSSKPAVVPSSGSVSAFDPNDGLSPLTSDKSPEPESNGLIDKLTAALS